MQRDKSKDDVYINCSHDSELNYVASLYADSVIVKSFLIGNCAKKSIKYFTYMDVYKLIQKELSYKIPC